MKIKNNSNNKTTKNKTKQVERKNQQRKGRKEGREIEKRRKRIYDCFFFAE